MILKNLYLIGTKLQNIRKKTGLTQEEVAEKAGISSRTYADIERGTVNPRIETILMICETLHITPDEILTSESTPKVCDPEEIWQKLLLLPPHEKETALQLLDIYLKSVIKQ